MVKSNVTNKVQNPVAIKCSRNTLRLLGLVIILYIAFLAYGYFKHNRQSNNSNDNNYTDMTRGQFERFAATVDSSVDTVRKYRDVFNTATTTSLDNETQDIRRITSTNHALVDKELEGLQGKISMLVQQMNSNLYRQLQRNYKVANDAAIQRSATDLSQLPAQGI